MKLLPLGRLLAISPPMGGLFVGEIVAVVNLPSIIDCKSWLIYKNVQLLVHFQKSYNYVSAHGNKIKYVCLLRFRYPSAAYVFRKKFAHVVNRHLG